MCTYKTIIVSKLLILASAGEISSLFGHSCAHNVYTTNNYKKEKKYYLLV